MYDILNKLIINIVNPIVNLAFAAAALYFIWGVYVTLIQKSEGDRTEGHNHLLWGMVGFIIMFSVFAIMHFIANTIGADIPPTIQ